MRFIASLVLSLALAALGTAQTLANGGTLAHFASGGGWSTTFFLFNTGTAESEAQLSFYKDDGTPVLIPLSFPQLLIGSTSAAIFKYTLKPGTVLEVESTSSDLNEITGWAQLMTGPNVNGYLVFRNTGASGTGVQEALVTPETRGGQSYVIDFDNTEQRFTTFAIANITSQAVLVTATARDAATGVVLGTQNITLPAMGHQALALSSFIPQAASASGTVEFSTRIAGQISVLGLRFSQSGPTTYAFTSTPPILKK